MDDHIPEALQTRKTDKLHDEVQPPNRLHLLNRSVEVTLRGKMINYWLGTNCCWHYLVVLRKSHHLESWSLKGNQLTSRQPAIV